jgi:uncharacterized protein (TIGR02246 family)
MAGWSRDEVETAVVEYLSRGERATDYEAWAELFTDDAVYVEHSMGVFVGRDAIRRWIVACMGEYSAVTNWTEWYQIDGSRVVIYAWNNFPAPTPSTGARQFPSVSVLRYAGDGMFVRQDDFYDAVASEHLAAEWADDGGGHHLPRDFSLRGVPGHHPEPGEDRHAREEVSDSFTELLRREAEAAETGDWRRWADSFSDGAVFRPRHGVRLDGRVSILDWVASGDDRVAALPRALWHMIDGNRVVARVACSVAGETLAGGYDRMVVLHYAGGGRWSYREDVFNPQEEARTASPVRRDPS